MSMKLSKLLAIETSSSICSVALKIENEIFSDSVEQVPQHAQCILPMIDALLKKNKLTVNQLDAIAWGRGPGSFTGLRIGASVVQGLAFAHHIPVIPVSTLQAIAHQAFRLHHVSSLISVIDARMQEVYWGQYEQLKLIGEEQVSAREKIHSDLPQFQLLPDAIDVLTLAEQQKNKREHFQIESAIPIYIRNKVVFS